MSRSSNILDTLGPGPFEAVVVNYLDGEYQGALQVELLRGSSRAGNQPERTGQIVTARYLSPFYGVTPTDATNASPGYELSQKSYGMWMVPPDLQTKVLVMFVNNDISNAFWIGCIQDTGMNFMTPGNASTTFNKDKVMRPVAEYNKEDKKEKGKIDYTLKNKPVHTDQYKVLHNQGLDTDETRGYTTSSARRELPSSVFGISTPGPVDKRNGAPKFSMGPFEAKATIFTNRLGGSSLVMDDGDDKFLRKEHPAVGPLDYANVERGETRDGDVTRPHNELVRLRTRTGHQILLHNSEDLIYIGNARGTSWIEMTSDGKIDIFADDSVSIHTKNDFNFKADRDFNFEAGRNFNIKANNGITMESIVNFQLVIGNDGKITTGNNFDLHTENNNKFTALFGTTDMLSGGVHTETASVIHHNGPQAAEAAIASPLKTHTLPGEDEVIMKRVPQGEPWIHHENLDGSKFKPTNTDRANTDEPIEDPTPVLTPDTFRKGL